MNFNMLKSCFISGEFVDGKMSEFIEVTDKYTGDLLQSLPLATQAQVNQAVQSAQLGFLELKKMSAGERADGLHQFAQLIRQHKTQLTNIIIAEAGKPRSYAATEIDRAVITVECAAEEAIRFCGEVINIDHHNGIGRQAITKRVPRGPIAAISPFNFPLNLAIHKIAPAIAVGCSVVLKPSPFTPLTALYLAYLYEQTDLPLHGLNVLVCNNAQAEQLVTADEIAMVSFTGSDKVGWHIKAQVPKKPVALELGGNAAIIVDQMLNPHQDIFAIAEKLIAGAFLYAGQICISTQRIYVHQSLYTPLLEAMKQALHQLSNGKIGDPNDLETVMGPLINQEACDKIDCIIQEALAQGAQIVAQTSKSNPSSIHGQFMRPATILTHTHSSLSVIQDEAFGPVCVVEPFEDIEAAIAAVNNTRYGLQVGVFTNSLAVMKQCFDALEVGGVIMNDIPGFRIDAMPYGGVKESGLGREGPRYAMEEMTEMRLLVF